MIFWSLCSVLLCLLSWSSFQNLFDLIWEFLSKYGFLSIWGSPCVLFIAFPLLLVIFTVCVWSLLVWLICVLGCFALGLSCLGLSGFLGIGGYFLLHIKKVFDYHLLKYFLMPFAFVFFWDTYDSNIGAFNIVSEVSQIVLIYFNSFFLSASFISTILSPHLSTLLPQLFYCQFPQECF